MILFKIIMLVIGLTMLIYPDIWWELTESWKSSDATEPSDFYVRVTRLGGIFFTIVAVAWTIVDFL